MTEVSHVADQLSAQRAALEARLSSVRAIVAVTSGKGGVGKTIVSANLAAALAADGAAVGALDADLNGQSLALALGVRGQRLTVDDGAVQPAVGVADIRVMSMDLLMSGDGAPLSWDHPGGLAADTYVWRGMLEANALREFAADTAWGELDFLVLDLPPGTDRFDAVARIFPRLDAVVMVTIPSAMSLMVVRKAIRAVQEAGSPIAGLVVNMAGLRCPQCGALNPLFRPADTAEAMAAEMEIPILGSVPFDPNLAMAGDVGRPLVLTQPEADTSRIFRSIAEGLRTFLSTET